MILRFEQGIQCAVLEAASGVDLRHRLFLVRYDSALQNQSILFITAYLLDAVVVGRRARPYDGC